MMRDLERIGFSTEPLIRTGRSPVEKRFKELEPPLVMGILNVTPDSFSDGGSFDDLERAVERALEMVDEGADIIDVGGESTRPFAEPVSREEELGRVMPVIERLVDRIDVPISVDTRHVEIAKAALDSGASLVNDVNGFREPGMEELLRDSGASGIIMHMKGTPGDMQVAPSYGSVIDEIHDFLAGRVSHLCEIGVERSRLIIDPGIGFGKRVEDNLEILRELGRFRDIGCPILIGTSRKSFIGHVLDLDVEERLEGSLSSAIVAFQNGASILRVHDVKETKRALRMVDSIQRK
ncbi:MAG: dihydropteroate synthase [Thermoplasmatota archaeon]